MSSFLTTVQYSFPNFCIIFMLSPNKQTHNFFILSKSGKTKFSDFRNSTTFVGRCPMFQSHPFILLLRLALKMKMSMGHFWKDIGKENPNDTVKKKNSAPQAFCPSQITTDCRGLETRPSRWAPGPTASATARSLKPGVCKNKIKKSISYLTITLILSTAEAKRS